ncbi:hypothetical protein [Methyloversatilis sp.]|uniref:hypothetical protein n=1 Tax=Methyloversatilis sp. TaxID=2569862 RepID=UPI0035AF4376
MTRDEKLQTLREWETRLKGFAEAMAEFIDLTQAGPESRLLESIYAMANLATVQAAALVGCSMDWLEAWALEHEFGKRPMRAGIKGEPLREIRTIEELEALIFEDANL